MIAMSSASSRSESDVKPTRSANSTVTIRRSTSPRADCLTPCPSTATLRLYGRVQADLKHVMLPP